MSAGRPRLQSADQAIFAADRAGVAKTTMYRRRPTRSHLVLETLTSVMRLSLFDSGDVRADLVSFARTLAAGLRALIDQLPGALHYRMLLGGDGPTDAYAERLVDSILEGALPPASDV